MDGFQSDSGDRPRVSWNNTIVVHTYNKDGTNKKTLEVEDHDNMRAKISQAISEDKFAEIQKKVMEKWGLLDNEVYVKWKLVNKPEPSSSPSSSEASTSNFSAQPRRAYKLRQPGKDEKLVYIESEPAALRRKAQASTCPVAKKSFILRQRGKLDKVIHMELEDETSNQSAQVAASEAPLIAASPRIPEERTMTPRESESELSSMLNSGPWSPVMTPIPAQGVVMRPPARPDHQVLFNKFNQSLDQIPEVDLNPHLVQRQKDSSLPSEDALVYEIKMLEQALGVQKRNEEIKNAQHVEEMSRMKAALVQAENNMESQRQQWEKEKATLFLSQKKEKSSLIAALTQAHKDLMTERKSCQDDKSCQMLKHEKEKAGLIVALDRAHKELITERKEWQKERTSLLSKQQKEKASLITALDQAIKGAMKDRNASGKRNTHFWQASKRMCPI